MFTGVNYRKFPTSTIRRQMESKVKAVEAKIQERGERLARIYKENDITPDRLGDILVQYHQDQNRGQSRNSYAISAGPTVGGGDPSNPTEAKETLVPAGVIANIVTEKQLVAQEKDEVRKMNTILRNLNDTEYAVHPQNGDTISRAAVHTLTDDEIEYLGL